VPFRAVPFDFAQGRLYGTRKNLLWTNPALKCRAIFIRRCAAGLRKLLRRLNCAKAADLRSLESAGNHQRKVAGLLADAESLHVGDHSVHQFAGGAAAVGLQRAPQAGLAGAAGSGWHWIFRHASVKPVSLVEVTASPQAELQFVHFPVG
jgi:hypothetical protein